MSELEPETIPAPDADPDVDPDVDPAVDPADAPPRRRRWLRLDGVELPILIIWISFAVALSALQPGHFWGDDFALYIRQGEGLVHFDTARVIRDIHYTVEWSRAKGFSPDVYPWGTSILLAIPLALFGRDIMALKFTMAAAFAIGAGAWFSLARRRLPLAAALGSTACFTLSLPMVRWVDVVGSDLPYLAITGLCLATLARWLSRGPITTRQAIGLGALGAAAFSFRNEGLGITAALLLGIGASHLFTATRTTWRPVLRLASIRAAIAGGVAIGITFVLQLFLPYDMLPSYKGSGPGRITANWSAYVRAVTDQFGFYNGSKRRFEAFGHPALGTTLLCVFLILLAFGVARMVLRHDVMDIVLLFTGLIHAYTALTFFVPSNRYAYVTVAVMFIAVAQGATVLVSGITRWFRSGDGGRKRKVAAALMFGLIAVFPAAQISPYRKLVVYAAAARDADRPLPGPYEDQSIEMYAAVLRYTTADDVILCLKPRAMTLFTNRSSVKIIGGAAAPEVATYMAVQETSSGKLNDVPHGSTDLWSNSIWHLLRLPKG